MNPTFTLSLYDPSGIIPPATNSVLTEALNTLATVCRGQDCYSDSLGWHRVEKWAGEEWLSQYESLAATIRADADAFVVIGIGGSNQSARAVIDSIRSADGPEIFWAGNTISPYEVNTLLRKLRTKKSVYIDIIAKNFETLEPGIGFRTMRAFLRDTYGKGWQKRVIATGTAGSHLEQLCTEHGFTFLPFPDDVGGRYTALTPVGLLPMAVAGLDIRAMARGASDMERLLKTAPDTDNPALRYALSRYQLYRSGYRIEMLSFFEPRLFRFAKWWVQLFGESEGKDGKGLFPAFGNYSEDLHSIGQFVQDGTHCLFETFIDVKHPGSSLILHADEVDDRFAYLDEVDYTAINRAALQGTLDAHSRILPCFTIEIDELDEYSYGQLFYFFMFACYLSGLLLGINPFDQPGVEAYKQSMFRYLGK